MERLWAPSPSWTGVSLPSRTSRLSSWVWCTTASSTPNSLYSFLSVLKQWAQVETTFLTLYSLNVSTFCCARPWKTNSLPAGRVAGAGLAVAQDAEADAGHVQQLGHGAGGLLGAVLVGAGAADPEQPVDLVQRLDGLADDLHVEVQALGPVHARVRRHVPRVALVLQALEQPVELGGEVRLDQDRVAAH